jgi:chromosome segregation protein
MNSAREGRAEAEGAIEKARAEINTLYQRHEALSRDGEDLEETQRGLKEKVDQIRTGLTEQKKLAEQATEHVNTCRVEISTADTNIANLIARASEDMGMDLLEEFEGYEHDEQRDWDAVATEIRELDGKIKRLGNVNLDAIAEQEELETREALYAGQIEDIRESHRQLDELIRRINQESRQLFVDTFEAARENFQVLFRKLFGGGRADILLTDPENVLESGIDIVARPPGKELRSLSLLSGGEKTMTALALLFSIFKCKPSPFCLLDEVDAALDEANTERFARLIQEFMGSSQFLVISHAKRTMSMANVLYGVTMQEPGVTKRIAVRFEDAEKRLDPEAEPVGV